MRTIVGVKYPKGNKTYYFDPKGNDYQVGDHVIVETSLGLEYAIISTANQEVEDSEVKHDLKPVVRRASARDEQQAQRQDSVREDALRIAIQKAEKHRVKLKFVDCITTIDCKKIMLHYTAEDRVDFRELVKDLASTLHARIELMQIYERDDVKIRGALAPCGRPCCCGTFLDSFEKVNIKMAKTQGLSLSPTKISGMCGKLMCCLKFENDYYAEVSKEMPKLKSKVETPDGIGVVDNLDMLRKEVVVKFFKEETVEYRRYPLAALGGKKEAEVEPEPETDEEE